MFHIVFNADDGYIKYIAVLMFNIIKTTNSNITSKNFNDDGGEAKRIRNESYIFHILSDYVSPENRDKLQKLSLELNSIYPCEIKIHILNDEDFKHLPKLGKSRAAYLRIKIASALKDVNLALYLDTDILILGDLREIFGFNLQGKILAACEDGTSEIFKSKNGNDISFVDKFFFNSGVMLIDLEKYRKKNIEAKCLEISKNYTSIKFHDQYILNIALLDECQNLPRKFNFRTGFFTQNSPEEILIFHFAPKNPWLKGFKKLRYTLIFYLGFFDFSKRGKSRYKISKLMHSWLKIAKQTPIFCKEF